MSQTSKNENEIFKPLIRALHPNDGEIRRKEMFKNFLPLREEVSRTLIFSLEEEENGGLSSLECLVQEEEE